MLLTTSIPKGHRRKRLHGPDNRPLHVMGELFAALSCKGRSSVHPVYVFRKLQQNLLGLPAIQSLNLLAQVDAVRSLSQTHTLTSSQASVYFA